MVSRISILQFEHLTEFVKSIRFSSVGKCFPNVLTMRYSPTLEHLSECCSLEFCYTFHNESQAVLELDPIVDHRILPCQVQTKIPFKTAYLMKIDQKENLCNTRITDFMASAKQIAWRKKFAKMSKAGKFKKSNPNKTRTITGVGSETPTGKRMEYFIQGDWRREWLGVPFWKLRKKKYYVRNGQTYFKSHTGEWRKIPRDVVKALKMKKG